MHTSMFRTTQIIKRKERERERGHWKATGKQPSIVKWMYKYDKTKEKNRKIIATNVKGLV